MSLPIWLNEQKLATLKEELEKKCTLFKLEKVDDLKKLFATLSAVEVVKLLDIPIGFETLSDGVRLLDALRAFGDSELDHLKVEHKVQRPTRGVKRRAVDDESKSISSKVKHPWVECERDKYSVGFRPNFRSATFGAANLKNFSYFKSTTMKEIAEKWNEQGKIRIVSYFGLRDKSGEKKKFVMFNIDIKIEKADVTNLLEFIRLEFDARMIPTPDVTFNFSMRFKE